MPPILVPSLVYSSRSRAVSCAVLVAVTAACEVPNFRGPQVQEPPTGYAPRADADQARRMFPGHEVMHRDAWVETSIQSGTIHINGHAGVLDVEDVQAAQDAAMASAPVGVVFGGLERLTVDGRQAWGWSERLESLDGRVGWVAFRLAIPYDTITYAVEFQSSAPELTARPDSVRAVVASFAVGRTRWNLPLLLAVAAALLLLSWFLRVRAHERAERLRGIRLATVPETDDGGEEARPISS